MSDSDNPGIFQAPEMEEVSLLFPTYDVHGLIACGGMGAVYQATQRSLDRCVAIKILPRAFSKDGAFRVSFEAEAKAMAKLNHPNLIGVYDFGEAGGMLYIIMEYVAGKSLFHSAKGSSVEPAEAIRIVSEVCAGLEHAHSHGILHRDIKPGNILLDAHISPKIGDFGLARPFESKIEEGEQIFGTPGYTAPEVLEPPFSFDQRADVFSVGVMLHELLTGKLPDDDPRPASQLCSCNPRLDAVIRRATHPDPAARYSSASEFNAELGKIASSPARAIITGASAAGRAYSPPKRLKSSSSGYGFPVLLLVLIAAGAYFYLNREKPAPADSESTGGESPETVEIEIKPDEGNKPAVETPAPPAPVEISLPAPKLATPELASPELATPEPVAPAPTPVLTPEPVAPKFDVPDFLVKARGIMADRIDPSIKTYNAEVVGNTKRYERKYKRLIRKLVDSDILRETLEEQLDEAVKTWVAANYRIPEVLPAGLNPSVLSLELHQEHLSKQEEFHKKLLGEISAQSGVYLLGLEKQIERLKDTDDQPAIDLLNEEIDLTKTDEKHFPSLFLK